jgi:hypothetical protein
VRIPYPYPNDIYEREMAAALEIAKRKGVSHVIFGDLFLLLKGAVLEASENAFQRFHPCYGPA